MTAPRIRHALHAAGVAAGLLCALSLAQARPYAQVTVAPQATTLAAAQQAEHDGDVSTAIAEYRALTASTDPSTAAQANLGLGRVLERSGRASDAIAPLQAARSALGGSGDGLRATFLLGEAEADSGANDAAAASFQAYIAGGGPAAGYAAIERGWALQAQNDDTEALTALATPVQASSLTIRRVALRAASTSHERLGDVAQAAADQQAIVDSKPPASDAATALLEEARLDGLANDSADQIAALQQIVQNYPATSAAADALDQLDALNAAVDPLQRAIVQFDAARYDDASATLQGILAGGPDADTAATATYYLGRIADTQDRNDDALADYAQATALAPNGTHAADALWRRAQLLRYLNRYDDARAAYAALVQQYPQSANAAEAAFDAGLMAYLGGHANDAATLWAAPAQNGAPADAARADLWLAKVALGNGDRAGATADLARAQTAQPSGYFGLRAELLANNAAPSLAGGAVSAPTDDWGAVESWLAGWAGPESAAQFQAVQATQDWREGTELAAMGWSTTPPLLLHDALATATNQPWALYRAARALSDAGLTELALEAADRLLTLSGMTHGGALTAPPALLRLAYPLDYLNLLNADGAQNGIDPLLLAAVARQESGFDPAAGSGAGAIGLLQLVPGTAQDAATALGLGSVGAADLKRPIVNLQLGAYYLAAQAKAQGGDFSRALAAYNGGGNASRWAKQAGNDPDLFYETIDFPETRAYVRLVSENYAVYTYLYRNTAHPTLVHP